MHSFQSYPEIKPIPFHSISKCSTAISWNLVFKLQIYDFAYIFDLMLNECDRK
jgi:hypothetical protein